MHTVLVTDGALAVEKTVDKDVAMCLFRASRLSGVEHVSVGATFERFMTGYSLMHITLLLQLSSFRSIALSLLLCIHNFAQSYDRSNLVCHS